jgi:predicted acylesterase/phospholipase RssA/CRP-like cAMP-binding protein
MDLGAVLAECPLFSGMGLPALESLGALAQLVELRSGERLFPAGAPSDCLYIVATGRMRAQAHDGKIVGYIGRLEAIGEMGALSGAPRSLAVHAIRDSLLIRIAREALLESLLKNPEALLALTRVMVGRLTQSPQELKRRAARATRAFALVPAAPSVEADVSASALRNLFTSWGTVRVLDAETVDQALGPGAAQATPQAGEDNTRLMSWLNQQETRYRYLVYAAGAQSNAWAQRCIRQADRVIVVTDSQSPPIATPMVAAVKEAGVLATVDLVLLRRQAAEAGQVLAWKSLAGARAHYFLQPGSESDLASLTRQIAGRGVGLVLGGGGARGFAHIGLIRALEELHIPVDVIGGSSMGAFIGALLACGKTSQEIVQVMRDTFVRRNYLNDYLLPRVALIRGRKFYRRLLEVFGDQRIEDLRRPFFCVSSNLTRGTAEVHDDGPLATWVATSMAVPGIAPPVVHKEELLVDGAVTASVPTDVMQALGRGQIIASDVSTDGAIRALGVQGPDMEGVLNWRGQGKAPNLRDILFRTATLTGQGDLQQRADRADLYLRMPVSTLGMFQWQLLDEIVERGYQYAREKLKPFREQLTQQRQEVNETMI